VELLKKKPAMAFRTFQNAMKLAIRAQVRSSRPLHVFQADEVETAFRHFQEPNVIGKRVVELCRGATIKVSIGPFTSENTQEY
jgi:hypothetical protein